MITFPEDLNVQGTLTCKNINLPAASVGDAEIESAAKINASKLNHAHRVIYAQGSSSNAAAATQVVHVVVGAAGTVQAVKAGAVVPAVGAATATVDVRKNGTTILTSPITLNNSQTARQQVSGAVSVTSLVAGDVLEIVTTATAGGGTLAQGLFAAIDIFEEAQ
jgi:hypothetical protein